jgi:hypothetical protein
VPPPRDELVIKVLVALQVPAADIHEVLQAGRHHWQFGERPAILRVMDTVHPAVHAYGAFLRSRQGLRDVDEGAGSSAVSITLDEHGQNELALLRALAPGKMDASALQTASGLGTIDFAAALADILKRGLGARAEEAPAEMVELTPAGQSIVSMLESR